MILTKYVVKIVHGDNIQDIQAPKLVQVPGKLSGRLVLICRFNFFGILYFLPKIRFQLSAVRFPLDDYWL